MNLAHRPQQPPPRPTHDDRGDLRRIAAALEHIAKLLDEFAGVFINARFQGRGSDRWAKRR